MAFLFVTIWNVERGVASHQIHLKLCKAYQRRLIFDLLAIVRRFRAFSFFFVCVGRKEMFRGKSFLVDLFRNFTAETTLIPKNSARRIKFKLLIPSKLFQIVFVQGSFVPFKCSLADIFGVPVPKERANVIFFALAYVSLNDTWTKESKLFGIVESDFFPQGLRHMVGQLSFVLILFSFIFFVLHYLNNASSGTYLTTLVVFLFRLARADRIFSVALNARALLSGDQTYGRKWTLNRTSQSDNSSTSHHRALTEIIGLQSGSRTEARSIFLVFVVCFDFLCTDTLCSEVHVQPHPLGWIWKWAITLLISMIN